MSAGAAGAAAAATAAMNAVRSFGVIVHIAPEDFLTIVALQDEPLVVASNQWIMFVRRHRYLVSFKGLTFFTESPFPLEFDPGILIVHSKSIQVP
jgi:hypothetical protein